MVDPGMHQRPFSSATEALCDRILAALGSMNPGVVDVPPHDVIVIQRFWRCRSLFDGVILLLRSGLMEEALILSRPLFEDALRLAELAEAGDQRTALAVGYARSSLKEKVGLVRQAARLRLESNPDAVLAHFDGEREKLDRYATRFRLGRIRPRSLADLSSAYGRGQDYWTYQLSHEMVHGSDAAWLFRRHKTLDGALALAAKSSDPQLITATACFAARSALQAAAAMVVMFGWHCLEAIDDLRERTRHLEGTEPGEG